MQPSMRLAASLALLQALAVSCSVASSPQDTLTSAAAAEGGGSGKAAHNHVKFINVPYKTTSVLVSSSISAKLLDRLSQLLTLALPTLDDAHSSAWGDEFESMPDSGLFGSGDPTFAWGGSTLEVVKTQATYVTRAAAFGPHIEAEQGQHGQLLPISDFYVVPTALRQLWPSETACPYKGGPGWRDDDQGSMDPDEPQLRARSDALVAASSLEKLLPPRDWVALVERGGGCSFAAKVRVAQALGAKAVVVGDAPSPGWHSPPGGTDDDSDPGLAGRLLTMYAPGDTSDIYIPSTFVTRPSYLDLRRLIEELARDVAQRKAECKQLGNCPSQDDDEEDGKHRAKGLEIVLARDDIMWEWPLIDLALMLLLLPSFMTIFTVIIHRIRVARQRRKDRAPEIAVLSLPCLIWRANGQPWEKIEGSDALPVSSQGETADPVASAGNASAGPSGTSNGRDEEAGPSTLGSVTMRPVAPPPATRSHAFLPPGRSYYSCDECAICLSDFVDGDKVRVLPCGHIFHRSEIDDWLVRIRKVCPICKRDVTVPIPPAPPGPVLNTPTLSERHSESAAQSEAELVDVAVAAPDSVEQAAEQEQDNEEVSQPTPPASENTPLLPADRQA